MLLTHYSRVTGVERLAADLYERSTPTWRSAAPPRRQAGPPRAAEGRGARAVPRAGRDHGSPLSRERASELLALDVELNAQGLEVWLDRDRR